MTPLELVTARKAHLDRLANQARVKSDFDGFFFALTENEITASNLLGSQHRVALFNKMTGDILLTSVPDIVARAKSSTWQLSVSIYLVEMMMDVTTIMRDYAAPIQHLENLHIVSSLVESEPFKITPR